MKTKVSEHNYWSAMPPNNNIGGGGGGGTCPPCPPCSYSTATPLVASLVTVSRATVEMDSPVWVSSSPAGPWHIDSVAFTDINEYVANTDGCDTNAVYIHTNTIG